MNQSSKSLLGGALMLWALMECYINETFSQDREIWSDPNYTLFMVIGDILLLLWMWGVSIQVWRSCGIDWIHLLGIGPHSPMATSEKPEQEVYEAAMDASIAFFACFVCFNMSLRGAFSAWVPSPSTLDHPSSDTLTSASSSSGLGDQALAGTSLLQGEIAMQGPGKAFQSAHVIPPALLIYLLYRTLSPWAQRKVWLSYLADVVCAPLCPVSFRCGYVGDILTSLARVLVKSAYALGYLLLIPYALWTQEAPFQFLRSGVWWKAAAVQRGLVPVLTLMPLWIRLMQCLRRMVETGHRWPQMANAFKYTSAIIVISAAALFPSLRTDSGLLAWMWVFAFLGATCFQFVWDLTMDWGLIVPITSADADSTVVLATALSVQLGLEAGDEMEPAEFARDSPNMDADMRSSVGDGDSDSDGSGRVVVVVGPSATRRGAVQRLLHWLFGGYALRRRRLLGPLWVYLCIILLNFLLRFAWILTIVQANAADQPEAEQSYAYSLLMAYLTPAIAAAEVVRRMVWGFLRLEWEHIEKGAGAAPSPSAVKAAFGSSSSSSSSSSFLSLAANETGVAGEDEAEEGEEEEEEELQPMMLSGHSGLGSTASWSSWFPSYRGSGSGSGSGRNRHGTLLHDIADPDGRSYAFEQIWRWVGLSVSLAIDSVGCLVETSFSLGKSLVQRYILTDYSERTAIRSSYGNSYGYYRRLFDDAPWCVFPVSPSAAETFALYFGRYFNVQAPDGYRQSQRHPSGETSSSSSSSAVEMQEMISDATGERQHSGGGGVKEGGGGAEGGGVQPRRGELAMAFERKSQLLAEAAAYTAVMLAFLVASSLCSSYSA